MRIANNIMALNAHRQLMINQGGASKSIEKLSSGLRINRAGDDAAGLAISEKMRGQIRGLNMAAKNAQDAISLIQTAEGALNETHAILQRMRELAVQAASDTNTDADRLELQKEVDQLAIELTRIANNTEFNTQTLLNGAIQDGALGELGFHIGANKGQFIKLAIGAMDAHSLGVARDVAEAELSNAVKVKAVEVGASTGSAIVDGAQITVSAQEVGPTAAVLTGGAADLSTSLTGISNTTVTITVDGTDYTLDEATLATWDGTGGTAAMITLLESATDGTNNLSGRIGGDETNGFTITSPTTGSTSSVSITITGDDAATVATVLGFTSGSSATGTNDGLTVTFSDGSGNSVDVTDVDPNATRISATGVFAGITLVTDGTPIDGSLAATIAITVHESTSAQFSNNQKISDADTRGGINISTRKAANDAISVIQEAIDKVSAERSKLGAYQNRLEHTIANLGVSAENLQAAESRIRDVDMAAEMMNFTKYQILQQASTAMLAQANLAPQSVLQLLG